MQRRHRPTPSKSDQNNNDRSSSLLPTTLYGADKNQVSRSRYGISAVPLLFGSILVLTGFVAFHYHSNHSPHPLPSIENKSDNHKLLEDHNAAPHRVNGHWEEWVVDDDGVEPHEHHVIDNVAVDDPIEFEKIEKSPPILSNSDTDSMVKGKFFKIHKQRRTRDEANAEMLAVESTNVDGEKKLKEALRKVVDDQRRGKNMNVEVISRWLGEDVPVIISKTEKPNNHVVVPTEKKKQVINDTEEVLKQEQRKQSFPSPADLAGDDVNVILKPEFGEHRRDKNAVFAFAEVSSGLNFPSKITLLTITCDVGL